MVKAATAAGGCCHMITPLSITRLKYPTINSNTKPNFLFHSNCRSRYFRFNTAASASSSLSEGNRQKQLPLQVNTKASKTTRRLLTVSTPSGRWPGKWTCDFVFSLKDLQLEDLAENGDACKEAQIFVTLSLHKHTGFGLSIDGKVVASIPRTCSICSLRYRSKIDTNFNVWILPPSRDDSPNQLPEIGGDDPSVIYVKPGDDAELDSLIQDTVRLQMSVNQTCSESCEKSEPKLFHVGEQKAASLHRRWSRLLELRNSAK